MAAVIGADESAEPSRWRLSIRGQLIAVVVDESAGFIDDSRSRVREHHRRIAVQDFKAGLQEPRKAEIVVRCPFEVGPGGQCQRPIVIFRRHQHRLASEVANPLFAGGKVNRNLPGRVGRSVIRDDNLEILPGLVQEGFKRSGDISRTVVDGQADADEAIDLSPCLRRRSVYRSSPNSEAGPKSIRRFSRGRSQAIWTAPTQEPFGAECYRCCDRALPEASRGHERAAHAFRPPLKPSPELINTDHPVLVRG